MSLPLLSTKFNNPVVGAKAISLLMTLVTWLRFVRRDIRLSGEGSWRLPLLSKRKQTAWSSRK